MKYLKHIALFSMMIIFLSGCINIPIGDGAKIKIGKNGFTITDAEGEKHKVELSEDEVVVKDEKTGENKLELTEEGMVYKDEDGQEQKITMEEKDGQVSIGGVGEDGEEISMQMGENIDIPEGFPTDIPLTKDAEIMMAMKQPEGILVSYASNESKEKIVKMYDDFIQKQKIIEEPETSLMEDDDFYMKMYRFDRKDGAITINISVLEDDKAEVSVIYNKVE